jgi:curved DNA-binding protein CbpA
MSASSDAYAVLGVSSDASEEDLRRAYRKALRRTHPDTGGVAAEFHAVQAAWESVGTPEDRARYDPSPVDDLVAAEFLWFDPVARGPQSVSRSCARRHHLRTRRAVVAETVCCRGQRVGRTDGPGDGRPV